VVSAPERGSTFTLYLPAIYAGADVARDVWAGSETVPEPIIPPLPVNADFRGITVLVVDDDMRNIFAVRSVLEHRAMEVLHAENGKVAIEILKDHPKIDLVLMDTMMPELDGVAATRAIREIATFRSLPIISLTAKAMKGDREKALEAGATDYVTKPVDPDKLLAVIHMWLQKRDLAAKEANSA
jgi:CheY-like chemotaxis protein